MKTVIAAALLLTTVTLPAFAADRIAVKVNGMVCDFCVRSINMMVKREPAVADVAVNLSSKIITISLKQGQTLSDQRIGQLVANAGYTVVSVQR